MNKDQLKGAAKNSAGKVQREVGKLVGSRSQEAKGIRKQVEGRTQQAVGDIKDVIKLSSKKKAR